MSEKWVTQIKMQNAALDLWKLLSAQHDSEGLLGSCSPAELLAGYWSNPGPARVGLCPSYGAIKKKLNPSRDFETTNGDSAKLRLSPAQLFLFATSRVPSLTTLSFVKGSTASYETPEKGVELCLFQNRSQNLT